jgi:hypothetical protein
MPLFLLLFICPADPSPYMFAVIQILMETFANSAESQLMVFTSIGFFAAAICMEAVVKRRQDSRDQVFFAPPEMD